MSIERLNTNPSVLSFTLKRRNYFPNSRLPVLLYKGVLNLPRQKNIATKIVQQIFLRNGWSNSWRNGIYGFHHYHSNTHEGMAVSSGEATVILGGPRGKKIAIGLGDVLILPAGVGHKCLSFSENFVCVGAYPQGKDYDTNRGLASDFKKAIEKIHKLPIPQKDPVFGREGFLKTYWK
jgi:uncharacterized protein YjlB